MILFAFQVNKTLIIAVIDGATFVLSDNKKGRITINLLKKKKYIYISQILRNLRKLQMHYALASHTHCNCAILGFLFKTFLYIEIGHFL